LVFQAKQSADHLGLQVMDLTDGSQRPLTQGVTAMAPAFFPDGKKVAFSLYDKKLAIYEILVEGGDPQLLSDEFRAATAPAVSPSGKYIAFPFNRTQTANIQAGIAIMDATTRAIIASHPAKVIFGSTYEEPTVQWSPDESEIYFLQLDNTVSNIMKLRIADGSIDRVTTFSDGRIFNFAVEPGGRRILFARGNVERDAALLQLD
jgi:Tol biopolymer transport system component